MDYRDRMKKEHRDIGDSISAFLEDRMVIKRDVWISKRVLYDAYVDYCNENGSIPITISMMGRHLPDVWRAWTIMRNTIVDGEKKYTSCWLGITFKK